jgi:hypothetical protein
MSKKMKANKIQNEMKNKVAHYIYATKSLIEKGYYIRGRNHNKPKDGGKPAHFDLYVLKNNQIETLCYNTTQHRTKQVLKAWLNGTLDEVPMYVLENYVTNGYTTRRGLFANYEKKDKRIKDIARSHADYLGCEIDATTDHNNRKKLRN